ncbi:hypothetical protein HT136_06970 [Novosphingobium profundi]|nr:hypothetical protein [Novosphingobium profundi]
MSHVRGVPLHPQDRALAPDLKNRVLLQNCSLPGDLEAQIKMFVEHCKHQRYHKSLNNVTPADAYFGRPLAFIKRRENIERMTIEYRLLHRKITA